MIALTARALGLCAAIRCQNFPARRNFSRLFFWFFPDAMSLQEKSDRTIDITLKSRILFVDDFRSLIRFNRRPISLIQSNDRLTIRKKAHEKSPPPLLTSVMLLLIPCACLAQFTGASTDYYRHIIFDNSLTPDAYFYSKGMANGSSFLELKDERLPVETKTFLTPPSALRLQWQSQPNGGWEAEIHVVGFRNRLPEIEGHNLYFWCFAPQAIAADDLPRSSSPTAVQASKRSLRRSPSLCPWESSPATFPQDAGFRFASRFPASIPPRYMSSGRRPSRTSSFIKVEPTAFATLC